MAQASCHTEQTWLAAVLFGTSVVAVNMETTSSTSKHVWVVNTPVLAITITAILSICTLFRHVNAPIAMIVPKRYLGTLIVVLALSAFLLFAESRLNPFVWLILALTPAPVNETPYTTHIVLFQFKESTSPTAIKEITSKMLALKKTCIHPSTGTQYIQSISGGRDNSIEDLRNGFSHAFILQFYSNEDRDYYVEHDPVHKEFKDATAEFVAKAQVVDFQDGVFT